MSDTNTIQTDIVINGDCLQVLKNYPDNFFDCIVSDVPYKICTGGARISEESQKKYGKTDPSGILSRMTVNDKIKQKWLKQQYNDDNALFVSSGKLFENCDIKFSEWLPEVYRVTKENTHIYLMINSRNLKELLQEAENTGFKFLNLLVWVKNNATPNKYYMQKCEFILLLRKGCAKNINDMGYSNVFYTPNIIGNKFHPTEKPVELIKEFIKQSTNEGDIVLDMFCGAGSTCIAAKELNRHFVGIEINKKYADIAKARLNNIALKRNKNEQLKLFK